MQVIGHLGKDATVNNFSGKSVINFSICHTEKYKNAQGEQMEKSTWVECAKWGDKTAVAQYLKKGGQVYVEGTPELNLFTRADGSAGASLKLSVLSLQLLSSGQPQNATAQPASQPTARQAAPAGPQAGGYNEVADDLPF